MPLVTIKEAAAQLNLSLSWFYHLPANVPGILRFGRAKRVDLEKIRQWAMEQQEKEGKENDHSR